MYIQKLVQHIRISKYTYAGTFQIIMLAKVNIH